MMISMPFAGRSRGKLWNWRHDVFGIDDLLKKTGVRNRMDWMDRTDPISRIFLET